jgi:dTDP-4-dehydrorhamnose reductase
MLGGELVRLLAKAGGDVPALDLPEIDITDPESLNSSSSLVAADLIFNCAGYTNVEQAEVEVEIANRINADGVANLADLAARTGALLVHISTDFVFDGSATVPYAVDEPPHPLSAYARSKVLGEEKLFASSCRWCLVRTSWLYGPGEQNFVAAILRQAKENSRLSVVSDQVSSPTRAFDLAQALTGLASAGERGIFHYTNAGTASWHEFACEIVRQAGLEVSVEPISTARAKELFSSKAERPAYSVLDCSKITGILEPPRRWQDALKDHLASLEESL